MNSDIHAARLTPRPARHALGLCLLAATLGSAPATAAIVFNVSFDSTTSALSEIERAEITSHLQEAGRRWARLLIIDGSRAIEIQVGIADIPTAGASSSVGFPIGAIGGRTLNEQGVAYELRTGDDPNGSERDATIVFGLNYLRNTLWFDPDPGARTAPVPTNRTDAMSTCLHEMGHMIAYNGWTDPTTGVPPETYWSTFDQWMAPGSPTEFTGPHVVASWGSQPDLTTGNNKHWGNLAGMTMPIPNDMPIVRIQWHDGLPIPPVVFTPPSVDMPLERADDVPLMQADLIDQLMNGVVFYSGHRYDISNLDIAVLEDVGLPVDVIFRNAFD